MIEKIKLIIFSRFKKPNEESFVKARRETCAKCEFNTLNQTKLDLKTKVIKAFSDLFSRVTGRKEEDNLGNCTACDICSIYFKSAEKVEDCVKGKWKKLQ